VKIVYILTHPIQYQSPLIRFLTLNLKNIDFHVCYLSDHSLEEYYDVEFQKHLKWDIDLLAGTNFSFSKKIFSISEPGFLSPINPFLFFELIKLKPDFIWVHGWNNISIFSVILFKLFFKKKIFLRGESRELGSEYSIRKKLRNAIVNTLILRNIDLFFYIGKHNREFYITRKCRSDQLVFMPYCVDNSFFYDPGHRSRESRDNGLRFLMASKLSPRKQVLESVDAFLLVARQYSIKSCLTIAGDGELRAAVEARCMASNGQVVLEGFASQTKLRDLYHNADVFVLLSVNEMWGLTVNEAMASGCAILTSADVGCAIDLVEHGVNGFVEKEGQFENGFKFFFENYVSVPQMGRVSTKKIKKYSFKVCYRNLKNALKIVSESI